MLIVVALAWIYVVAMMAVAEATAPDGTMLGAVFTLLLYGALPLAIVLYVLNTPARKRLAARKASAADPGHADHAAGDPLAPEREEP